MIRKTKRSINYTHFSHRVYKYMREGFFNHTKKWVSIVSIIALLFFVTQTLFITRDAEAAGLNVITTTLASEGAGDESTITVVFTPQSNIADNDRITVYIGEDSGNDPWVDTDATIDFNDVECAQVGTTFDGKFQNDATGSSGVSFGCDASSAGDQSNITVTLGSGSGDDMYNPAAADIYTVSVVTTDDSGAGLAYVGDANDVTVSVTVLPNLSMVLDSADGTYCTGTPVVTCNLGTATTSAIAEGNYDIQVGTNAATGATISIAETGNLGTIDDITNDTAVTAGVEDYGLEITETGVWVMQGNYVANDTPIETGPTAFAQYTSPILESGDDINVKHQVGVSSITAAGTHSHTVIWTATGTF